MYIWLRVHVCCVPRLGMIGWGDLYFQMGSSRQPDTNAVYVCVYVGENRVAIGVTTQTHERGVCGRDHPEPGLTVGQFSSRVWFWNPMALILSGGSDLTASSSPSITGGILTTVGIVLTSAVLIGVVLGWKLHSLFSHWGVSTQN